MELGYNHAFCTVDHKRSTRSHVRNVSEEYILYDGLEIHMLFVVTAEAEFRLQWHGISKTALHTLFDGVTGRINKIIQEFQHENIPRIGDREIFLEHFEQAFNITLVRRGLQLEEFFKRLDLYFEQVWRFCKMFNLAEIDPWLNFC